VRSQRSDAEQEQDEMDKLWEQDAQWMWATLDEDERGARKQPTEEKEKKCQVEKEKNVRLWRKTREGEPGWFPVECRSAAVKKEDSGKRSKG
jgi:hypothetical protein